jgi:hypothetical protein
MLLSNLGVDWQDFPPVVEEYHHPPRRPVRGRSFNTDYVLRFVPKGTLPAYRSFCARVLPCTMGAEVFLTVDANTLRPLLTELVSGEAFQLRDFKPHVELLEAELARLDISLTLRKCDYCRMFVIDDEICFLIFPVGLATELGARTMLRHDADSAIASHVVSRQLVCVDGWLRTEVCPSERILEAESVEKG